MLVRPFKLINASERRYLESALQRVAQSWAAAWLLDDSVAAQCFDAEEGRELVKSQRWLRHSLGQQASLYVSLTTGIEKHFAAAAFGNVINNLEPSATGPSELLNEVYTHALRDLGRRLFEVARFSAESMEVQTQAPVLLLWQHGSGAIVARLSLFGEQLALLLDAAWVNALLRERPRSAPARVPLAQRAAGLSAQRVPVRIWAGEAQIEFGVLQTLAVGDVVKLNSNVHTPLGVTIAGEKIALSGYLGQRDGYKAVQLSAAKPH